MMKNSILLKFLKNGIYLKIIKYKKIYENLKTKNNISFKHIK